jgi:N6-L-threonylcarbamoyladenine synthase
MYRDGMIVLGLESSCDETATAVVDGSGRILAERVASQLAEHRPYGGVVPEIAARAHLDCLDRLVAETLAEAGVDLFDLDGVAATAGPGLIGGVMVGATMGKALALGAGCPFLAINHLEGHALTVRMTDRAAIPYLLLLVSGGHCQLLAVLGVGRYRRLGTTLDDAAGEAFDKVAKLLGLGYPGGPALARAAESGDPARFRLPRPMLGRPGCDFSFSGLKTAVRQIVEAGRGETPGAGDGAGDARMIADLAAATQAAITDSLVDRCRNALRLFRSEHPEGTTLVAAGGVAANLALRRALGALAAAEGMDLVVPPPRLCTDNGAMIAWAGLERLRLGLVDGLDFAPRPRWPLDPDAAPVRGAGVKA